MPWCFLSCCALCVAQQTANNKQQTKPGKSPDGLAPCKFRQNHTAAKPVPDILTTSVHSIGTSHIPSTIITTIALLTTTCPPVVNPCGVKWSHRRLQRRATAASDARQCRSTLARGRRAPKHRLRRRRREEASSGRRRRAPQASASEASCRAKLRDPGRTSTASCRTSPK
eukprot:scaffold8075_cov115-Isochrysis_galbana.AAC.10